MAAKLCNVCNIRRPKTGNKGTETSPHNDMCNYCFEEGGWENSHSDSGHEGISAGKVTYGTTIHKTEAEFDAWLAVEQGDMAICWICNPALNLAQKPAKGSSVVAKVQGVRRPQLNHKGHNHPQTPAARRACKGAFWAFISEMDSLKPLSDGQRAEAFAKWDHKCDGHGKAY